MMAKAGALRTIRRRSQSVALPDCKRCTGAGTVGIRSMSWIRPSDSTTTPAIRPDGSSANASVRAVMARVPVSPVPSGTVISRSSVLAKPATSRRKFASASAVWLGRSLTDWLALSSITAITMSERASRFSRCRAGFAKATSNATAAKPRSHQPRNPRQSDRPITAALSAAIAQMNGQPISGSNTTPVIAPTYRVAQARGPDPIYNCPSAHASRG